MAEQINTTNRYESLSRIYCDEDTTGNATEANADKKEKREPKPSPIYIYCVSDNVSQIIKQ
jgi:hypothetical protein